MTIGSCGSKYISNEALVDNKKIDTSEYVKKYINSKKKPALKCCNGHELMFVNCKTKIKHFRHKNDAELGGEPISEWHKNWQSKFTETEVPFEKKEGQVKMRKADVLLKEHNLVVEFQHSHIESSEVDERKKDYGLNNCNIMWVIDGGDTILVKKLDSCNRVFLEFTSDIWKYNSFECYDHIYIDIKDSIYKVCPKSVKSNMIDVEPAISKEEFIQLLKNNDKSIHNIVVPPQCNMYIKQQGAGNGKTYGLIQMLQSAEFEHYKCLIAITKQHSAKHVIKAEFDDQIKNGKLQHLEILKEDEEAKKYIIMYKNKKTNEESQLIVATVDSFIYSLGNTNHKELDKFGGIVNSIIDGYDKNGSVKYAGLNLALNKEICVILDETQDLTIDYAKAIVQIMRNKYVDTYIVGDKLQSIKNSDNAFVYILENSFPYINSKKYEFTNVCRRFTNKKLIDFVNKIVPFEKYDLPHIETYKNDEIDNNPYILFSGKTIRASNTSSKLINDEVDKIMEYYKKEVTKNKYNPNDFLIVTPFTKKNPLVDAVETAINVFWEKKQKNNKYTRYAIFHRSEEGSTIDLKESENATRIVSIHSSKGDGRNVVFVIGMTEHALNMFSGGKNNIIYDSLIHVAITRMKKKLYIRIENNGDNINSQFSEYVKDIEPILSISKKIKYKKIIDDINNEDFKLLYEKIIKNYIIDKSEDNDKIVDDKIIIDIGHHNIKYASMLIYLYIKIIKNDKLNPGFKKQITTIFSKLSKTPIYESDKWQEYNKCMSDNIDKSNNIKKIPILKISDNGIEYLKYYANILEIINNVKIKINKLSNDKGDVILCPIECVVLYYMIETTDNGMYTSITINELYNIIDVYSKSFIENIDGHDDCLCKKLFIKKQNKENTQRISEMRKYLLEHYEKIQNTGLMYDSFLNDFPKVEWLINHPTKLNGTTNNFLIHRKHNFIGYCDSTVFLIYVKPQVNDINYNNILIESIFDTYLLQNICNEEDGSDNYKRFANKKVVTVIFASNKTKYIRIDWNTDTENLIEKNKMIISEQIRNKIINKYTTELPLVYHLYKYFFDIETNKKLKPKIIIKNIIKSFEKKIKENEDAKIPPPPKFVCDCIEKISNKVENTDSIEEQQYILKKHEDMDFFINPLQKIMVEKVNDFFGIEDETEE